MKVSISIVLVGLLLGGCGSNNSTGNSNTGTGYYIDSAVSGVSYVCGNESGVTGEDGSFVFEKGKGCTFKLGDITLRNVNADNLTDKVKIVEDRVEVAQMLQSLDIDGNPDNGITISAKVVEKLKEQQIAKLPETTQELETILDAAKEVEGFKGKLISAEEAKAHLEKSQTQVTKELFAGKTFYFVDGSRIKRVEINQDATKLTFIDTDGTKKIYNSEIKGNTIVDEDGIHYIDSVTEKYISGHDKRGTWKFYFNKSDAQKASESSTGSSGQAPDPNSSTAGGNDLSAITKFTHKVLASTPWYAVEYDDNETYCVGTVKFDGNGKVSFKWNDNGDSGEGTIAYSISDGKLITTHDGKIDTNTIINSSTNGIYTKTVSVDENTKAYLHTMNSILFSNKSDAISYLSNHNVSSCYQ